MARSFGKIFASIWGDGDYTRLSRGAQHVYELLVSQGRLTLAGSIDLMPERWASMSADTTVDDVLTDLAELIEHRFVVVDWETREVVIRTLVRHEFERNPRLNINLIKGLWTAWSGILSPVLRKVVVDHVPDAVWERSGTLAPFEAAQMRRSAQLELPVPTDRSGQPTEPKPPKTRSELTVPTDRSNGQPEHISISPTISPSPEEAASREPRELSPEPEPPPPVDNQAVEDVVDHALVALTDRELARNPTRASSNAHRNAVLAAKRRDHTATAHRLLHLKPGLTPTSLADLLEPPPTADPLDGMQRAARARQQAATAAMHDLAHAPPPDPDEIARVTDLIADIKTGLSRPSPKRATP